MTPSKKKTLDQLSAWQEKVGQLQTRKAKLKQELLKIDVELWSMTGQYDTLCRKLMKQ